MTSNSLSAGSATKPRRSSALLIVLFATAACLPFPAGPRLGELPRSGGIEAVNVRVATVEYRGRPALRVAEDTETAAGRDVPTLAILEGSELAQGTIELDIAGVVAEGASPTARGFVGIAFHVTGRGERYQSFYLRPTNGRAPDQARRNHATQYHAIPGYPWSRLRAEEPGVFESYVDLVPGDWTRMRIELQEDTARLFVHDAPEPVLIVNDLKTPDRSGAIALWIGPGSIGYFSNLRVRAAAASR